jgi:hypothetical protein
MFHRRVLVFTGVALALAAMAAEAQFGRGFRGVNFAAPEDYDGQWHYCRPAYNTGLAGFGQRGGGGSFTTDYPNADINLSIRLSELTKINVSKTPRGEPNHLIVPLDSEEIFQCPLLIMSAPGSAVLNAREAANLRAFLLKGGLLWTDDSWGSFQWQRWTSELRKVLPADEYPIFDIPLDHAIYRSQFVVTEVPQIPNIGFFLRTGGGTSEQGADSAVPVFRGIADSRGELMVVMTHNTDIADSWEREGEDPSYFYAFSPRGYAFGINVVLYAMTH